MNFGIAALVAAVVGLGLEGRAVALRFESRVETQIRQMSVEEKIGQLCQIAVRDPDKPGLRESIRSGRYGTVIWNPVNPKLRNEFQRVAAQVRGFRRVNLSPGETKTVRFRLLPETFSFTGRDG